MSAFRESYIKGVTAAMRGFALFICGFAILNTLAAVIDLTFELKWGYPWAAVPVGLGMAVAAYGFNLLIKKMGEAMLRFEAHISKRNERG